MHLHILCCLLRNFDTCPRALISPFDYAAISRDNGVSPDLSDYVIGVGNLRAALRKARDINASEDDWQKIIDMLENQEKNGGMT